MNKQFDLLIDTKRTNYNNVRGLKQGDNNSVLNITLVQDSVPFNLENCSVRINYRRTDGKVFLQMADVVNAKEGQVKVNVLTKVLEKSGIHEADLSIFDKDNRKITSTTFTMFVEASVYTNDYLENEDLDIIQDIYVKENERIANEKIRVENENIRKSNEEIRKTSENDRIEAETTRINDENIRKTNEEKRVKNEDVRQANEGVRVKNETNRISEFETIKSDYKTYKNVMIAESNVANLQNQINKHEGLLKENATKEVTLKDGVEHLDGGVDGILNINSIGGNTLYKREDGTYTDTWEENVELESVKDKIEIVSCGKNLFDGKLLKELIDSDTGCIRSSQTQFRSNLIKVKSDTDYTLSGIDFTHKCFVAFYDENKNYISRTASNEVNIVQFITPSNCKYVAFNQLGYADSNMRDTEMEIRKNTFQLEEGTEPTEYEPYREDKTIIQLKEPLRSLPNGVKDTFKDGMLVRRVGKVVLDGSEEWEDRGLLENGLRRFSTETIRYASSGKEVNGDIICDKIQTQPNVIGFSSITDKGISIYWQNSNVFYLTLTDGETPQIALKGGVIVLYELEEPTIEKIEPIKPLKCWQDGSLITNSNINPIVNFKYPTNLNSRLSSVEENTLNNSNFVKEQNAINLQFDFRITALENKEELV